MRRYVIRVLAYLSHFSRAVNESRVVEDVLKRCKDKRSEVDASLWKEEGCDIYPQKRVAISDVIAQAIEMNYVSVIEDKDAPEYRKLLLTEEGYNELMAFYTHDHSEAYQSYLQEADQIMVAAESLPLERVHIANSFYSGTSVESLCHRMLKNQKENNESEMYHIHLMELAGIHFNDKEYLFHFMPKLFLPREWQGEKVSLEIEGVDVPEKLYVSKPYPNKRYVVAGVKYGKDRSSSGYYPIVASRELFPTNKEILLKWKIGESIEVHHKIHLTFDTKTYPGNLFSTMQYVATSSVLESCDLTTTFSESMLRKRVVVMLTERAKDKVIIKIFENAKLYAFPMHLHSCFYSDVNFSKWYESFRK